MPELEREDSQRSVNFSRPMSPPLSPAPAPARPQSSTGWFTSPTVSNGAPRAGPAQVRPQSATGFSSVHASRVQQDVQAAANKPVKKKKKTVTEGARLANGTMNTGPQGTVVNNSAPGQSQAISSETTPVKKQKKTTIVSPVNTQMSRGAYQEPSSASSATDDSFSPNSPQVGALLHKPSVVREDPEAEATAEYESMPAKSPIAKSLSMKDTGRTINTSEGPVRSYVALGAGPRARAVSLDIPRGNGQRSGSLSPSRNVHAHFGEGSSLATPLSIRHQPPPRSVSPMKSALRQSPASSVRTSSPNVGNTTARVPASDASDTTSMASQDGIKPAKRKKNVRISEDGGAPVSPVVDPNGRRELSGTWANDDINDILKPRPALPSFGSVRGRKQQPLDLPEKVTETVSSSVSNSVSTLPERQEVSNDHAVGAVIAHDHAKQAQNPDVAEPLPPQVTSVEGSGNASDSAYSEDEAEALVQLPAKHEQPSDLTSSQSGEIVRAPEANPIELAVPDIAIQPATPGIEEETKSPLEAPVQKPVLKKRHSMPGEWGDWEEQESKATSSSRETIRNEALDSESESSEDEAILYPAQTDVEGHSPHLQPIYESDSDSDDSAAFSDAAEDLSEFDHGGFASLNAIVESPVTKPSPGFPDASPAKDPKVQLPPPQAHVPEASPLRSEPVVAGSGDWGSATAYWSSLSKKKKEELEAEAVPVRESAAKPKKKKPAQMDIMNPNSYAPPPMASPPVPIEPDEQPDSRFPTMRKSMRQSEVSESAPNEGRLRQSMRESEQPERPASQTHMRSSMRGSSVPSSPSGESHMRSSMRGSSVPSSPSGESHLRKSMRSGGPARAEGSMRSSMRGGDASSKPAAKRASAPVTSTIPGAGSAALAASVQSQSAQKPAKSAVAPPPAYDSDSESSFKKKRRGSVSTVDSMGKYTMKRSMRGSSMDMPPPPPPVTRERATSPPSRPGTGRLSLRSLSPSGSFLGRKDRENLRSSIRGAPADDTPTMRGKNSKASRDSKGSSGFSMSGFGKSKPSPAPAPKGRSGFKSRFVDSDDEDDAPASRGGFRSRFADSDEEDSPIGPPKRMPADLAPVRGIPKRRGGDSDSTDLSDSEDEPRTGRKTAGRANNKPAVPSQSDIDAAMEAAKRNVAAMNGGREPGVPQAPPVPASTEPPVDVPTTPTRRKGFLGSVLRRNSSSVIPTSSPSSVRSPKAPKLQRRTTPQNWPLPAATTPTANGNEEDARPTTSDGVPAMKKSMRPDLGRRSMSGNDLKYMANGDQSPKKKKFSRLRKVFGLHD